MSGIPGQQSVAYISQLGAGYSPIASGLKPNYASAFEGLPIPGGRDFAPLLQMALGPSFQGIMSRAGMTGMGLGHDQNVYDRIIAQQFQTKMQSQLYSSSELDRNNYMQTMQGVSALFGVPFGAEQRVAANRLADLAVSAAPMFAATNPELLDMLSGSRGSAVVLGQRLGEAGRYRLDPVSGKMGVDPETIQKMTKNIMDNLYSPEKIAEMKGIGAGQLGGMYEQLSLRGLLPGSEYGYTGMINNLQSAVPQQELLQKAKDLKIKNVKEVGGKLDLSGLSAKDIDLLTQDQTISEKLRDFDANKIKSSLKSYVNAISAMRDIFGDAGRPNAPIPELMRALEGLSTGSMGQVDPQRLGQMVRQTYYLAKSGGISADAAGLMQQDAATRGQQLGIESPFAMLATQNSLAYNTALRSRGVLATPLFGGMSESQLTQMNTSLTQQGVASSFGTRVGTLLRMQDILGTEAIKNTDLGKVIQAIQAKQETVNIGGRELKIANLSNADIENFGKSAGISQGQVQTLLEQKAAAREALFNNPDAVNYIREIAQPSELKQLFAGSTRTALQMGLKRDFGVNQNMEEVSNKIIERLANSPDSVTANTQERTKAIATMLNEMLPPDVKEKMFAGKTPEQQQQAMNVLAASISGNLDVTAKRRTNAGNFGNVNRLINPSLLNEGSNRQLIESLRNDARAALSGISSGSALRNAIDALKEVDINDQQAFEKVIGRTFGGVYDAKIGEALKKPIENLNNAQKELDTIQRDIELETDPKKKQELRTRYQTKIKLIENLTSEVRSVGEKVNAYSATGLTQQDMASVQNAIRTERNAVREIAVVKADDARIEEGELNKKLAAMQEIARNEGRQAPTREQAMAEIVKERRNIKPVTEAQIKERMNKDNLSREDAKEILQAETDAKRLGFSDDLIKKEMAQTNTSYTEAVYNLAKKIEIKDPDVLQKRLASYEESKAADRLRSNLRGESLARENIIKRGLDASSIQAYGVGIAEQARELQTVEQERQNLIAEFGGSETKFLAGASEEQRKQYEALGDRAQSIQTKMSGMLKPGGPTDEEREGARSREALKQLGVDSFDKLSDADKKRYNQIKSDLKIAESLKENDIKTIKDKSRFDTSGQITAESRKELESLAKEKGTDVDTLIRANRRREDFEIKAKEDKELISMSTPALADRLKSSFNIDDKTMENVKAALGSYGSRQKAAAIIRAQEGMTRLVSAGGVADAASVQDEYARAVADPAAMTAFRQKYKITSQSDFEQAEANIRSYKAFDVDRFKGEDAGKNLTNKLVTYDDRTIKENKMPTELVLSGKLSGEFSIIEPNKLLSIGDTSLNARSTASV